MDTAQFDNMLVDHSPKPIYTYHCFSFKFKMPDGRVYFSDTLYSYLQSRELCKLWEKISWFYYTDRIEANIENGAGYVDTRNAIEYLQQVLSLPFLLSIVTL